MLIEIIERINAEAIAWLENECPELVIETSDDNTVSINAGDNISINLSHYEILYRAELNGFVLADNFSDNELIEYCQHMANIFAGKLSVYINKISILKLKRYNVKN